MEAVIKRQDLEQEFWTPERCSIYETWNEEADRALSVARARVETGTTTQPHALDGIDERYLIVEGFGLVEVAAEEPTSVQAGDFVFIKTVEEANVFEVNRLEPHPCTGEYVHVSGTVSSRYTVWDSGLSLNVYHSDLVGVDANGTQYRYVHVGAAVHGTPRVHTDVQRFISAGPGDNYSFYFHFNYNANGDLVVNNVTGECSG